jgi:predicted ABC-type exoprotein transport system permease subunit
MKRIENILDWLIKRSWFFSASLFLGLFISGSIQNKKDFFSILIMCLILWSLDSLFIKKGINNLYIKVLNIYKIGFKDSKKGK